ncbi:hypothetical protein B0T26DRAFT_634888 [Lasiosphaeria miniovina]|uniref:MADS-box MEF2 type transcription factor MIG1 n=1 Tax=Lasiosphaeria miniovina TaxID=1954250 RepID=A0AA40EGT1_9PEZI|nr:uncharacterized protein B0T26DRAFT_634888 [Lasiosphaeria miniovina]KAK0735033.1 hypothetical protein B0T26DRAFT_634888 [Lasiosphaeria miniovina]
MGRRKIEIKAIKDDRNRSVTFLKRKGGLFKKAHELSVLCSVDVAVFIFGSNKKLYEYSSCDMRELITKYTYHGGPNEHKGPSDFNGGADDDDDDDENGTPPHLDGLDGPILPGHFQGPPPFGHIRHQTPSQSPPVSTSVFSQHSGRGQTPQPQINSRPSSRNDGRRMQSVGPQGPPQPNSFAFMPQPAIYNPQNPPNLPPNIPTHGLPQQHSQYPYGSPQPHPHQLQPFLDDQRRSSLPSTFSAQPQGPLAPRHSTSPPQPQARQLPSQPVPHMSPSPPQHHAHSMQSPPQPRMSVAPSPREQQLQHPQHSQHQPSQEPQPPAPVEPKTKPEPIDKPRQSLLLDTSIKKQPQRKQGSIFTPIDENRSILSQHLAAFHPDVKSDRSQSIDTGSAISRTSHTGSPPGPHRSNSYGFSNIKRNGSMSSIPETVFTPPSRSNSLHAGGGGARPRLKVQIPEESSDAGSATAESSSPRGTATTDATSQPSRRLDCHSGVVLPPPSPSASALLSAGASGPPNPFARPHPHQNNNNMNIDTPVSALPSRFLNNEYLPSPSSFYPDWNFRGNDSNTLPSPLNFATPVVGTGPSFLRDDPGLHKRKSPEINGNGSGHDHMDIGGDAKRVKVDS